MTPFTSPPARLFRHRWRCCLALLGGMLAAGTSAGGSVELAADERATVIVVVGAAGEEDFGRQFAGWAEAWKAPCARSGAKLISIGLDADKDDDLNRLQAALQAEPKTGASELWLVLLGHGTFDGKIARFNLRGPDLEEKQLAAWLAPFERPLAVVNASSASAPFLAALSKPGRVVVSATKSGNEQNFARFGGYFSKAIGALEADLDKDGQVSLLEAWLHAASQVAEFYKTEGRLATEHSLLDDSGDGQGTPADWFRGVRAVKKAAEGALVDGRRAHQFHLVRSDAEKRLPAAIRARRNELELEVFKLRDDKAAFPKEEYDRKLEELLLQMARLYEEAERKP
jgi:hypothetical protein